VRTGLVRKDVEPKLRDLVRQIYRDVPAGVGSEGAIPRLSKAEARDMLVRGAVWAVERGFGTADDLEAIEDRGVMEGADPDAVPDRAYQRGLSQLGTLGSGNHFLEIQYVDEVYLPELATRYGLEKDTVVFAIHSGSRGFGHQICESFLRVLEKAVETYGIRLSDKQLACAPWGSPEAKQYWAAMACAANFAWTNRQVMKGLAERAIARVMGMTVEGLQTRLIYDVCHNIAKVEEHGGRRVIVHRKGATRAFGPGHPAVPPRYRDTGQPVFIPGDMGRASFLLVGTKKAMEETFGSSCHGAGRAQSRSKMLRQTKGRNLFREMEQKHGVIVMARGMKSVAEEMPEAYKDASLVVDTVERAGISRKVVRLRPIGCVKG
jgi:tRNA-splicing ligase RtcB